MKKRPVHLFDLRTEYCTICGSSMKDVYEKKLQCIERKNITAISHSRAQRILDETSVSPSTQNTNPTTK
jgi:hypothetical protein